MPVALSPVRPLVLVCLLVCALRSGEAPEAPPPATTSQADSPLLRETRQYVAQLTEQRNQLREENDILRGRQGLLLIYGAVLTLLSGWLAYRTLTRPAGKAEATGATDVFPADTTTVVRKNATITIRNSDTQRAEVTEQVQTRRAFARGDTAAETRRTGTRPVTRHEARSATTPTPTPAAGVLAPGSEPAAPVVPITTRRVGNPRETVPQAPATVRVEQHSDRLSPVEVSVKPGTGPVRRVATGS